MFESPTARNLLARLNVLVYAGLLALTATVDIPAASHLHELALTPAAYTFSIWFLIYVLLGIYVIRECCCVINDDNNTSSREPCQTGFMRFLFTLSCIFNGLWCVFFCSGQILAAFVAIMLLWVVLLGKFCYYTGRIQPYLISPFSIYTEDSYTSKSCGDYLFRRSTFTLYYGWTCAACVLSMMGVFHEYGCPLYSLPSSILLGILTTAYAIVSLMVTDWLFGWVGVWALVGIIYRAADRMGRYDEYMVNVHEYDRYLDQVKYSNESNIPKVEKPVLENDLLPSASNIYFGSIQAVTSLSIFLVVVAILSVIESKRRSNRRMQQPLLSQQPISYGTGK